MSRRVVFLIALISLAVLGAAAVPWTLTGSRLSSTVAGHLRKSYGLDLTVEGRSTFAVLPTPRVKFENMTLAAADGSAKAEGGTLRGELRLLPLLFGRLELSEVMISETRITASHEALRALDWAGLFKEGTKPIPARRLIVAASSLSWTDLKNASLDRINGVINWEGASSPLYAVGSASWRGETVTVEQASFTPNLLAAEQLSPFSLTLSAPSGRLAVTGEALLGSDPRVTGESLIQAKSVRNFTRWSGLELPFASLIDDLSIQGDVSINRRRLSWPSVAVTLGGDKLDGTLSVRLDAERPLISGTLAAENLNLSDFVRPLAEARARSGGWSEDAIDLTRATGSDLDLRLSATNAQFGRILVNDMAAGVLVQPGRIEASIGRADLGEGTFKGRLSLVSVNGPAELKGQASFERVDLGPFLKAIGEPRWIAGRAQGQFALEGSGKNPAELMRKVQGRMSVTVKEGELIGIALDDALRRVEKRPLLAFLHWKGGRTPFDQAQAHVSVKNGIGVITEGRLTAQELIASFQGDISLADRALDVKADVTLAKGAPDSLSAIAFEVSGSWDNILVRPEVRPLIERSGAAKPLFGPRRPPLTNQAPLATAQ
ncbi:AsmA-like C-terminal region-containing protein [Microvirga sp. GCM10011540]|uniref:AsmA family protein n=1 Tax=Microvirga sp. GCM10011540 TaxID=3317338 RepID=UPI0036110C37